MEHFDYKFLFKVLAFLFKNRKALKLSRLGDALRWLFAHPVTKRCILYLAVLQRIILIPASSLLTFAAGCCVSVLYLLKTQSVIGFMGIMLLFVVMACVSAYCMYKATPRVSIRLTITEVL